jgi:hypothetical protein
MSITPITPGAVAYGGEGQMTSLSTVKRLALPSYARWAILVPELQDVHITELEAQLLAIEAKRRSNKPKA